MTEEEEDLEVGSKKVSNIFFRKFHSVWGLSAVVGKKYAASAAHLKAPASQNFPGKETKEEQMKERQN